MSGRLAGRTALITGAGRGFGRAIAEAFLDEGATVALHHHRTPVTDLTDRFPDRASALRADLTDPAATRQLAADALAALGSVEILVNNAGVMAVGAFAESTEEQWASDIGLNIWAPLRVTHALLPSMTAQGHGKIINISSQLALKSWDRGAVYAGTKGFLLSWTKSLAAEAGPHGITVNAIGPGSIVTDMNKDIFPDSAAERAKAAELPLRRLGTPADVAGVAVFLASAAGDFMTGQMLGINGGSQM
ncbi:SDR family oxidoreductase [Micromonospora sp. WMMD1128]|uniref:SDR family NAD(P)-dependent oxidoreductase n=1 Tax=unclassified Micromonospora TaxID=2617518 RepID=UPI00248AF11E|nr:MULTISPECIES: SDR family oxidoreductase [unclassified Micromonospora]WBB71328.1 SDR family oxidoreductase [Micromonospora sp. WMMD1128]WFE35203.1 SDR family oxidoreductase [Micromonospora sp. WMMD975]